MGIFNRAPTLQPIEEEYPVTVVMRTKTEADRDELLRVLDRALALALKATPTDRITLECYRVIHAMQPPPPAPRYAKNVVRVAPERWRKDR